MLERLGAPLRLREVPTPVPGPGEVLVRTRWCGICRTDLHLQAGVAYVPCLPHIPGHEPSGTVAAVGTGVQAFSPGEVVIPHLFVHGDAPGAPPGDRACGPGCTGILGVTRPGGFADYYVAPAANLVRVPAGVPEELAGLASCAGVTAVRAVRRAALPPGSSVVVIGAGGVGSGVLQLLAHVGHRVGAIVRHEAEVAAARAHGAQVVRTGDALGDALGDAHVDPDARHSQARAALAALDRDGVAAVVDTVGSAASVGLAATLVRDGGTIVLVGEEDEHPGIPTSVIAQRELRLIGTRNGSRADLAQALALLAEGVLRPPVRARYPLAAINQALEHARAGAGSGRVLIDCA